MNKWLEVSLILLLVTCAECQEPGAATRNHADALFKAETAETTYADINTTLRPTEIETNSTADAQQPTTVVDDEEDIAGGEWTTVPAQHEYSISIKDVFEKGVAVVRDEMKGIGIIQAWLKEKAEDALTTDEYDHTQATDVDVGEEQKQNEPVQDDLVAVDYEDLDAGGMTSTEGTQFVVNTETVDALAKIEDDLEKLRRIQAEADRELKERDELIADINKNLNELEEDAGAVDLTTEGTESAADEDTTSTTPTSGVSSEGKETERKHPVQDDLVVINYDDLDAGEMNRTEETQFVGKTEAVDALPKIEDDLEKLRRIQSNKNIDINTNLNKLEGDADAVDLTTEGTESAADEDTTSTTPTSGVSSEGKETERKHPIQDDLMVINYDDLDAGEMNSTEETQFVGKTETVDALAKIEDDLEKLRQIQSEADRELKKRDELIEDINKNLNELEGDVDGVDLTTEGTESAGEQDMSSPTSTSGMSSEKEESERKQEVTSFGALETDAKESTKDVTEIMSEMTVVTTEMTMVTEWVEEGAITIRDERTDATEETNQIVEIVDELATVETDSTDEEIITTQEVVMTTMPVQAELEDTDSAVVTTTIAFAIAEQDARTEAILTTEDISVEATTPSLTSTTITTNSTTYALSTEGIPVATQTSVTQPDEDGDNTLNIVRPHPDPANHVGKEADGLTTVKVQNAFDIVDAVVDEIIDEIEESEANVGTATVPETEIQGEVETATTASAPTSTKDPTLILLQEAVNLTDTIDKLLREDDKMLSTLTSNSIQEHHDPKDSKIVDTLSEEDKEKSEHEEADVGRADTDLQGTQLLVNSSEENKTKTNKLDDKDDDVDHSQGKTREDVVPAVARPEPKLSAVITDDLSGSVCLNASGLSIKITTNNVTQWVPPTAKVFGQCTTRGAHLNLTWRTDQDRARNTSLSFTVIADDGESYIEEVLYKTSTENLAATQAARYLSAPIIIRLNENTTIAIAHLSIKLHRRKEDYATISLLSVDNALALQIASGGLCTFIVLVGVAICTYKKLRGRERVFKVSLDK